MEYCVCMQMDATYGIIADHYSKYNGDRLAEITVLPPYEPRLPQANGAAPSGAVPPPVPQWVRGSIRVAGRLSGSPRDLVVTGPPLTVVYSGCRWNRLVLAMPGAGNVESYRFERWIRDNLIPTVRQQIWSNPTRFKPGALTNQRFVFDDSCLKTSSDSTLYPDELVTRLSVRKPLYEGDQDLLDTEFLYDTGDGIMNIDPSDITAGSVVQPIIKISYNRIGERFGLVLTILKAKVVSLNNTAKARIENSAWVFDEPEPMNVN